MGRGEVSQMGVSMAEPEPEGECSGHAFSRRHRSGTKDEQPYLLQELVLRGSVRLYAFRHHAMWRGRWCGHNEQLRRLDRSSNLGDACDGWKKYSDQNYTNHQTMASNDSASTNNTCPAGARLPRARTTDTTSTTASGGAAAEPEPEPEDVGLLIGYIQKAHIKLWRYYFLFIFHNYH